MRRWRCGHKAVPTWSPRRQGYPCFVARSDGRSHTVMTCWRNVGVLGGCRPNRAGGSTWHVAPV
eukprot:4884714-Pyramimonas_sp.AAC.3